MMIGKPTSAYLGASWLSLGVGVLGFLVGLWNATSLLPSEKGFYAMAFTLSLFAVVTIQKNVRDLAQNRTYYGIDNNNELSNEEIDEPSKHLF